MATNLTEIRNFINEPHCDLGVNAWVLAELVKTFKDARFLDLGVRLGASSAILSIDADENNNQVCGCDLMFDGFQRNGARFVKPNYMCYQADSVTLGKNGMKILLTSFLLILFTPVSKSLLNSITGATILRRMGTLSSMTAIG